MQDPRDIHSKHGEVTLFIVKVARRRDAVSCFYKMKPILPHGDMHDKASRQL